MIVGIVCEYNPFHNGHLYHLLQAKKLTKSKYCIAVMSGNYVQRGEPAICDKHLRTLMALKNGIDIVIELPVIFATSSAEYFSNAAISLLDSCNIVDNICFGGECADISKLDQIANLLIQEPYEYKLHLKKNLDLGLCYPAARSCAVDSIIDNCDNILNKPNNILAIEYLKSLKKISSRIKPFLTERIQNSYNSLDINSNICSATAIRNKIKTSDLFDVKKTMPKSCLDILHQTKILCDLDKYYEYLKFVIFKNNRKNLSGILDVVEGLENRISNLGGYDLESFIKSVKTKRHTYSKISRALLHIFLDIKKSDFQKFNLIGGPQYIRILGFRRESSHLIRELKKKANLPIIVNSKDYSTQLSDLAKSMFEKELESTDLYYFLNQNIYNKGTELKKQVVIL